MDDIERSARLAALQLPHMLALNQFVHDLRRRRGEVPYFDPLDGGSDARLMILLETPGPKRSDPRFTSRDNQAPSARNLKRLLEEAGIPRGATIIWNAVPWVLPRRAGKLGRPTAFDLETATPSFGKLLEILPALDVIVTAGVIATKFLAERKELRRSIKTVSMAHPSPVYLNTRPDLYASSLARLRSAYGMLEPACEL